MKSAHETLEKWRAWRYGMFIHYGVYAAIGRHEHVMVLEGIPRERYIRYARDLKLGRDAVRNWVRLARNGGMRYVVLTTKHHEGFCLWNTRQTDFNSMHYGPKRDVVAEFVEACRAEGMGCGLYYSLMDWHHPDGMRCARSETARRRFVKFTHACVEELCTNYGPIDILWYDIPEPLKTAEAWESQAMNDMVRRLQPGIIMNDRSRQDGDFATSEQGFKPPAGNRPWEACITPNGVSWGYMPSAIDWMPERGLLFTFQTVARKGCNFLLNVGPAPDGTITEPFATTIAKGGAWLRNYGEVLFGNQDSAGAKTHFLAIGDWTVQGNNAYLWAFRYPGREFVIGGFETKVKRIVLLGKNTDIQFEHKNSYLRLLNMPRVNPDPVLKTPVIRIECTGAPRHRWPSLELK